MLVNFKVYKGGHASPLRLRSRLMMELKVCLSLCGVCVASAAAGVSGEALGRRWDRQTDCETVETN